MARTREERIQLINEKGLFAPAAVTLLDVFGMYDEGCDIVRGQSEDGFVLTERHGRVDPELVQRTA